MKILLFGLNGRGGMLHYTSQYANALAKKAEVYVVLPSYSDKSFFDKKVNLIRMKAPFTAFGAFVYALAFWQHDALMKKIRKIRPDVVHIMDNHPWYISYALKLKNYPLFVTQHDPIPHSGERYTLRGIMSNFVNRFLRQKATKVIVHGENLRKYLLNRGISSSKILVFPHGDYTIFRRWIKKGVKTEPYTVLCFGRLVKYKGIGTLIKAIEIASKKIPKIKAIIAGSGDFSPWQDLVDESNTKHLEMHIEYIPDDKVAYYFQRSAAVVLPYDDASQSGPLNIAYAFKKPVIVTRVGSLPEIVDEGKTGYIVPPKNPRILADRIVKLLKDKRKLKSFGENAYKKMQKISGWNMIASNFIKEYRKAAKSLK
jgi:glycosyltransferase involved in cell wall biosynthesis